MPVTNRSINIGSAVGHMMLSSAAPEIEAQHGMLFSFGPGKDDFPSDSGHQFFIQEFTLSLGYERFEPGTEGTEQIRHPSPREDLDIPGWVGYDPIDGLFVMENDDDKHAYAKSKPLVAVIIVEHPRLANQWIVIHLKHDEFDFTKSEIVKRRPEGMSENDANKLVGKFPDKRVDLLKAATLLHRLHSAHASVDEDEDRTYAQA